MSTQDQFRPESSIEQNHTPLPSQDIFNQLLKSTKNMQNSSGNNHTRTTVTHSVVTNFQHVDQVRDTHQYLVEHKVLTQPNRADYHVSKKILAQDSVIGHIDPKNNRFIPKNKKIAKKYAANYQSQVSSKARSFKQSKNSIQQNIT